MLIIIIRVMIRRRTVWGIRAPLLMLLTASDKVERFKKKKKKEKKG